MGCKLTIGQIAQRMQTRSYQGPAAGNIGTTLNFAFAISDPVPLGKAWMIYAASVSMDTSNGSVAEVANQEPELFILKAGTPMPSTANQQPYTQYSVFLSHKLGISNFVSICNGPPVDPAFGVRIDDSTNDDIGQPAALSSPQTLALLRGRTPLLVGPGEMLLVNNHGNNTGGGLRAILSLTIRFVELSLTESVESL